jgi:hypothetical protein
MTAMGDFEPPVLVSRRVFGRIDGTLAGRIEQQNRRVRASEPAALRGSVQPERGIQN